MTVVMTVVMMMTLVLAPMTLMMTPTPMSTNFRCEEPPLAQHILRYRWSHRWRQRWRHR
jgi:hypothetical protein